VGRVTLPHEPLNREDWKLLSKIMAFLVGPAAIGIPLGLLICWLIKLA
jgi:hypothetical protein